MDSKDTVAVIDVGSNSIKILVARAVATGIETVFSQTIETRISAGISEAVPELDDASMAAGVATIFELYQAGMGFNPEEWVIVATSAVRDAINGAVFMNMVLAATGIEMRILSGQEEATYIGRGIACDPALKGVPSFLQMDIGGGSLELIRFQDGTIVQAISLQLGAVRLTERFIADRALPITAGVRGAIETQVAKAVTASGFDFRPGALPLVATGGAFVIARAILAGRRGLELKDSSPQLTALDLRALEAELSVLPLSDRIQVPYLPPARADIVPTALITILKVLELAGRDAVTHSFYNLRYGMAAELLQCSSA